MFAHLQKRITLLLLPKALEPSLEWLCSLATIRQEVSSQDGLQESNKNKYSYIVYTLHYNYKILKISRTIKLIFSSINIVFKGICQFCKAFGISVKGTFEPLNFTPNTVGDKRCFSGTKVP